MASGAIGLVLARPTRLLGVEPFFMELIGGIEERFVERGLSVLLHVVPGLDAELEAYRRWAASGLTDAVVVVNLSDGDPRPALLTELGLRAVLVGDVGDLGHAVVRSDDDGPMRDAAMRLILRGHRRLARITGPRGLTHTQGRTRALRAVAEETGIELDVLEGDYTEASGADLTHRLLTSVRPPTAILYDNDLMALAGLRTAQDLGVDVPGRLSMVAWDDSAACRLANPPVTVMGVDVHRFGRDVGQAVIDVLDGRPVADQWSPVARWVERGTTAGAPTLR